MLVTILVGFGATLLLLLAGAAIALCWSPDPHDDDTPLFHVALALGWGFGLVPYVAFCWALFTGYALTPWTSVAAASGTALLGLAFWKKRRGGIFPVQLRAGWKPAALVLLACLGVGLVYLLKYDRSVFFLESCIHRVVMQTLQLVDRPIHILSSNADDQRLGNTAVISTFVAMYRGMGFRLLYAFVGVCAALGGYLLVRRATGSARWGWFGLVALPLNPYVAGIPLLDENLLMMGYASLALPLVLRKDVPWGHAGLLLGLCVMMRHVAILSLPAALVALLVYPGNRRWAFARSFLAFNLVTLVGHVHHYQALGSVFAFESFGQIPEFEHRFLGAYSGLLQWPFADHVLRTPWNPLPTFLMWPTYVADHLGLVLFAALIVGSILLLARKRAEGGFWWAWTLLPWIALSLQENWDVPNKMGVIYTLFHPLIVWAAFGLQAAVRAPKRAGAALVVTALASGFGITALAHVDVPQDVRYYEAWEGEREEDPAYVLAERKRVTNVDPWPDYARMGVWSRVAHPGKWSGLLRDLADPALDPRGTPYGWFRGEAIDPAAPPVVLEIDLSQRLFDHPDNTFVRIVDTSADNQTGIQPLVDLDLTVDGPTAAVANIRVPWSPRPVTALFTAPGADVTGVSLIFEAWRDDHERRDYLHDRYHRGLMMVLGWDEDALFQTKTVRVPGDVIRVRVPQGPFSFVESVNNAGQNYLFWRANLREGAPADLTGPSRVFHN